MKIENKTRSIPGIKISAGCLIILNNNKVLLGHPSNNSWNNSYSPPKGGVDPGESILEAAIRETKEEMGLIIDSANITNLESPIEVKYSDKKGKTFKKVYLYTIYIESISEIGLSTEILNKTDLQLEELDWAGFLTKEEAKLKVFHRFWGVINDIL